MISKLPDSLISHILSYLPTKEAVRTSVLSKTWKNLWLSIPGLDLESTDFPNLNAFVGFMEKFIEFSRQKKSCLHKLKLSTHQDFASCVTPWIEFAATPKLEYLDVSGDCLEVVPLSLFICEKLFHLRLVGVMLESFECVSLPCVKTMCLTSNIYANEASMELLISSCPVLEDLRVVRRAEDNVKVLRVRSRTISSLSIRHSLDDIDGYYDEKCGVSIDTPRLKYLNLDYGLYACKTVIINSSSFVEVDLYGICNNDEVPSFISVVQGYEVEEWRAPC